MSTITVQKTEKDKALRGALASEDLDKVLHSVKKLDNTCTYTKCKVRTSDIAIVCKYCQGRFCTSHGLPEVHGCGEAVRRDEKRKFLHPTPNLSREKHDKAKTKFDLKLKQMQQERKPKQSGGSGKKK